MIYSIFFFFFFSYPGIDPRSNKDGANIEAFGLDDVVITDGNGTIVSPPRAVAAEAALKSSTIKREAGEEIKNETETKERRKRETDGKNENGGDKSEVKPVSFNWFGVV